LVARRGTCSFAQKVKMAQEQLAAAVIIVDRKDSFKTKEEIVSTIVADDEEG